MNRFYISPEEFKKDIIKIRDEDFKHLTKVLRLVPGDNIEIYNDENMKALGTIKEIGKSEALVELSKKQKTDSENDGFSISLFQGYPKQGKLEIIVQKSTELGVSSIVPFYSKRSVVKPSKNESKKTKRLQRIAYEAAKQCGRGLIPKVESPLNFNELIDSLTDYDLILLAYEDEKKHSLKKTLMDLKLNKPVKIALLIGPEGGFEKEEVDKLKEDVSVKAVGLGNRILRTETAGIAAISQLNFYFEE